MLFHPFRKLQGLVLGHQVLQVVVDGSQFLIEQLKVVSPQHLCEFLDVREVPFSVLAQPLPMAGMVPASRDVFLEADTIGTIPFLQQLVDFLELLPARLQAVAEEPVFIGKVSFAGANRGEEALLFLDAEGF